VLVYGCLGFFVGVVCVCATVLGPYIRSQICLWGVWWGFVFVFERAVDGWFGGLADYVV